MHTLQPHHLGITTQWGLTFWPPCASSAPSCFLAHPEFVPCPGTQPGRMETLGPLYGAGICILPPTQCHAALGAGQTEGFGDIFLDNTMEISPLISMPGRAPFSTHPLALSSASSLTQSCLSAPALLLFQPRLSPEESLTPCRDCFCHQLGVTVTFGVIGSCFFAQAPSVPGWNSASIWMQSSPGVTAGSREEAAGSGKGEHSY